MRVLEIFTQIIQMIKRDQLGEIDVILTVLTDMELPKMMAELNQLKKDEMVFNLLWVV